MKSSFSKFVAGLLVATGALAAGDRVAAHHSASVFFDPDNIVTIRGVITEWSFTNPHPFMTVKATDESGETADWLLQFTNALNMRRLGLGAATFTVGMEVAVTGPRSVAEGTFALNPELVVLPDGTEIRAAPGQGGERGVTRPN